jgi:hypothetical protein
MRALFSAGWITILLFISVPSDTTAAEYTRYRDLGPIRMGQDDLVEAIRKIQDKLRVANGASSTNPSTAPIEFLQLSDEDEIKVAENGLRSWGFLARAPRLTLDVHYHYILETDAPITRIDLVLADDSRVLSVTGQSENEVNALSALLMEELNKHTVSLAGPVFRIVLWVMLMVFLFAVSLLIQWKHNSFGLRTQIIHVPVVLFLWCLAAWLPAERWFPGTAVFQGDPSFANRNAGLIGLIGLIITIISIPFWPQLIARLKAKPVPDGGKRRGKSRRQNPASSAKSS